MTGREVIQVEPTMMPVVASPNEIIVNARAQATALMDVVEKKKLYALIGQGDKAKKYLEYEAWQLIGAFNSAFANTEYVRPLYESPASAAAGEIDDLVTGDGSGSASREILAYEAKVNIVKHGEVLASAVMVCGMDSFPTKGRTGIDKDRAAMSAAQTWAASKAYRMVYSYIAVLADYEPTPAAEMTEEAVPESRTYTTQPVRPVMVEPHPSEFSPAFEAFKKAAKDLGYETVEQIEGATGKSIDDLMVMPVDELRVKYRELASMAGEPGD
jgi:hypothetical protein